MSRKHRRKMEIKHIFLTLAVTGVKKSVSYFSCFIHASPPPKKKRKGEKKRKKERYLLDTLHKPLSWSMYGG
jgi:hypothetical protein